MSRVEEAEKVVDDSTAAAGESNKKTSDKKPAPAEVAAREKTGDAAKIEEAPAAKSASEKLPEQERDTESQPASTEVERKAEAEVKELSEDEGPKTPRSSPVDDVERKVKASDEMKEKSAPAPAAAPASSKEASKGNVETRANKPAIQTKPRLAAKLQQSNIPVAMAREHIVDLLNLSQQQPVSPDAVSPDELSAALREIASKESEEDLNQRIMSEFVADFGIGTLKTW